MPNQSPQKTETSPSVSVVIPTHNRRNWIAAAIASVERQTYTNIVEIIVVDDASTDETVDFIKSEFPNIRLLTNESNQGACVSRNKGGEAAIGDYIAFLDSDDQFNETKIENQISAIQKSEAVACTCAFQDSRGLTICKKDVATANINFILRYRNCLGGATAILIERQAFLETLFNIQMKAAQDWEFFFRLSQKNPVTHVTTPLYFHETSSNDRITDNQLSRYNGHKQLYELHLKRFLTSKVAFFFLLNFLKAQNPSSRQIFQTFYRVMKKLFSIFE